ncbi:unnamed protein product [Thelazia callipaeda]|uniref:Kazal-like domain-containing protein n=1 Tax=Thelazia callipaeda TaxID=103827 RepID=A0A0N5D9F7_THECL|nr:unnamed protein product [Thelazia callipaeda]
MDHRQLCLFTLLLISVWDLSSLQKLPGSQDLLALLKTLNFPFPNVLPKLPLLPIPGRKKLYGLPPLPNYSPRNLIRSTLFPIPALLFKPLTFPRITLPPLPKFDNYGINTIPELPPQHESIYNGMFAPDGSLIKKNKNDSSKDKGTETNQFYNQEKSEDTNETMQGSRKVRAETATSPIVHDDQDRHIDEKLLNDQEYDQNLANFLWQNIAKRSNDQVFQSARTTDSIIIDKITHKSIKKATPVPALHSLNAEEALTTSTQKSELTELKVKSTTLTRLAIVNSKEEVRADNDENELLSNKSEIDSIHVYPMELTNNQGGIIQSKDKRASTNPIFDQTTIRPIIEAFHSIILNRQISQNRKSEIPPENMQPNSQYPSPIGQNKLAREWDTNSFQDQLCTEEFASSSCNTHHNFENITQKLLSEKYNTKSSTDQNIMRQAVSSAQAQYYSNFHKPITKAQSVRKYEETFIPLSRSSKNQSYTNQLTVLLAPVDVQSQLQQSNQAVSFSTNNSDHRTYLLAFDYYMNGI